MQLSVPKCGNIKLDALHAYGLGVFMATSTRKRVIVEEKGPLFQLTIEAEKLENFATDSLDEILALPSTQELEEWVRNPGTTSVKLANLDGLLAVLFTTPGFRAVSLSDLANKVKFKPTALADAQTKVKTARDRWLANFSNRPNFLTELFNDYNEVTPVLPRVKNKPSQKDIKVLMTLEPSFSYANRAQISSGFLQEKDNVAFETPRYISLLIIIGAARFLRAQRVAANFVNFYLPIAKYLELPGEEVLPLLPEFEVQPNRATLFQALSYTLPSNRTKADWRALAYQTLQTQGRQQSLSAIRGCIELDWLAKLKQNAGAAVLNNYKNLIAYKSESRVFDLSYLVDCLLEHQIADWQIHLEDISNTSQDAQNGWVRLYSLKEVREITKLMNGAEKNPLHTVLSREGGTLRFGRALRQLGKFNLGALRDILDSLGSVQNLEQLLDSLASAVQVLEISKSKNEFGIVPTDPDLQQLLEDVDCFTPRTIAKLLSF